MTCNSRGECFMGSETVRVIGDHSAINREGTGTLKDGDVFKISDAVNGNVYWIERGSGHMESVSADCVTEANPSAMTLFMRRLYEEI